MPAVRFSGDGGDLIGLTTALIAMLHLDEIDVMDLRLSGIVARKNALGLGTPAGCDG